MLRPRACSDRSQEGVLEVLRISDSVPFMGLVMVADSGDLTRHHENCADLHAVVP